MIEAGQYDKAIEFLHRPKNGVRLTEKKYLADAYLGKKEYQKAIPLYKQALRRYSARHWSSLNTGLAKAYLGLGKIKSAKRFAKRAVKQDSANQEAQELLNEISQ